MSLYNNSTHFFCRSDQALQDIVYKLVPGLFKGWVLHFILLRPIIKLSRSGQVVPDSMIK